MYYSDKIDILKRLFGASEVSLSEGALSVNGRNYPVLDDVIILSSPGDMTELVKQKLKDPEEKVGAGVAEDVQFSFGEEWKRYGEILPEHENEFGKYFDIVDVGSLSKADTCDLGCGMGRWSSFLAPRVKSVSLVDFSDAIFVARKNLKSRHNCLFFMCDIKKLPFAPDAFDFIFSLGVLHHLPSDCLDETRALKKYAAKLLVFLYYALDNRPFYFKVLLGLVTVLRKAVSGVRSRFLRKVFALFGTFCVYLPLIAVGRALKPLKLSKYVPLYEFYHGKTAKRIEQDVYDRFFTSIEQRVTKKQIEGLSDTYSRVVLSDGLPYWHFLLER
ncbi:MAG: class I SAM-dependent methyltransferase [Endomicrobiales bacterium]|nr:class I SAM-dependent methyltransferase [Endomicrobiales bacterium]